MEGRRRPGPQDSGVAGRGGVFGNRPPITAPPSPSAAVTTGPTSRARLLLQELSASLHQATLKAVASRPNPWATPESRANKSWRAYAKSCTRRWGASRSGLKDRIKRPPARHRRNNGSHAQACSIAHHSDRSISFAPLSSQKVESHQSGYFQPLVLVQRAAASSDDSRKKLRPD